MDESSLTVRLSPVVETSELTRDLTFLRCLLLCHTLRRTDRRQSRVEIQRAFGGNPCPTAFATHQLVFGGSLWSCSCTAAGRDIHGRIQRAGDFLNELEVGPDARVDEYKDNTHK